MPRYDYFCQQNNKTVEVSHPMDMTLRYWGEVCYAAQLPMGDIDFFSPVRRVLHPPNVCLPTGNTSLKEVGFTKLVKRDQGVYENVTALDGEQRYMVAGDKNSLPHLHKKIES